jgi:hypothetical protein
MRIARSAVFAAGLAFQLACGPAAQTPPSAPAPDPDGPARTSNGGPAGSPVSADPLASSTRPRSSRDEITEQEIAATATTSDAFELVRRLRPEWLRSASGRGQASVTNFSPTQVYYNGRPLGNLSTLREIGSAQIISMRWVDPIQARTIYGRNNNSGVISVTGR